ncbi:MAG: hypothetical protein N2170_06285 [Bacteroidia bacterium]|nr:hypothetical protein [Bacteroidia bacterium]
MRYLVALSPSFLFCQLQLSQNPVSGDCRMPPEALRPLTPSFFPYLYRYEWDPQRKLETIWLSPTLRLRIEQRACIRHHVTYELRVFTSQAFPHGLTRGLLSLLDTVITLLHRNDFPFLAVKNTLWPKLFQQAAIRSLGEVIMLPHQEWSFLLRVDQDKEGPVILLETIRYLSSQSIQRPGVPDYMDDGWSP